MSNRLADAGRLPLLPQPLVAAATGAMFTQTRDQTDRARALGRAFLALPADLFNLVRGLEKSIESARILRDLSGMSDHMLADIGIRRDQLPMMLREGRLDDFAGHAREHRVEEVGG